MTVEHIRDEISWSRCPSLDQSLDHLFPSPQVLNDKFSDTSDGVEEVLFGDTTDKDRPSVRGRGTRVEVAERGRGKIKLLVTISTGLYLKRHLFCLSGGSLGSQKSLDPQFSIQSFSGYILTTLLGNRWIQDGNGVSTDERGNGVLVFG